MKVAAAGVGCSNPDDYLHLSRTIHSSKLDFYSGERPKAAPTREE